MNRHGVTLLEVLLVIVISTSTLSIAALSWDSMQRTFLSRTGVMDDAEEVMQCLRMARETAVMSQTDVSVRYVLLTHPDLKQPRYAIEFQIKPSPYRPAVDANGVSLFGAVPTSGSGWMADPIWLHERTTIRSDRSMLTFDASGNADQDTKWQLSLDDKIATTVVYAITGNIEMQVSP
jgi:prepilin-type N-terminal cleavage/methylation domain-containing protein